MRSGIAALNHDGTEKRLSDSTSSWTGSSSHRNTLSDDVTARLREMMAESRAIHHFGAAGASDNNHKQQQHQPPLETEESGSTSTNSNSHRSGSPTHISTRLRDMVAENRAAHRPSLSSQDIFLLMRHTAQAMQSYRDEHQGVYEFPQASEEELASLDMLVEEALAVRKAMKFRYERNTVPVSWARLREGPNNKAFGYELYHRLVPQLKHVPEQLAVLSEEERIEAIMAILDKAVANYEKPHEMAAKYPSLGAYHLSFGVDPYAFYELRNAFCAVQLKYMDPADVAACQEDWTRFWNISIDLFVSGCMSEKGAKYAEEFRMKNLCKLRGLMEIITARQKERPFEQHLIRVMFEECVKEDPNVERFKDVYTNQRSANRLYASITHIMSVADRESEVTEYLRELGARHATYDVTPQMFSEMNKHFVTACSTLLEEEWTPYYAQLFGDFYSFIERGVVAGMDSGKNSGENLRAPDGSKPFCMLFTDIESSTNLWQRNPDVMRAAVERHHRLIRTIIADYGGYEVKTAGDSFIIAAPDVLVGMKIAIAIQLDLMRDLPIAPGFKMLDEVQGHGDASAWSDETVRVRIGIEHCTEATATYDTIHRRYDYYGTSVNRCARIEAAAAGGQILMSRETFRALKKIPAFHSEPCPASLRGLDTSITADDHGLDHFIAMCDVGFKELKGIKDPVRLASAVPLCFSGREFP